jgi:hypothetical protein
MRLYLRQSFHFSLRSCASTNAIFGSGNVSITATLLRMQHLVEPLRRSQTGTDLAAELYSLETSKEALRTLSQHVSQSLALCSTILYKTTVPAMER